MYRRNCSIFLIPSAGELHTTGELRLVDFKFTKNLVLIRRNGLLLENGFEWTLVSMADLIPKDYINNIDNLLLSKLEKRNRCCTGQRRQYNTQIHFLSKVIPYFKKFIYICLLKYLRQT